MELYFGVCCVNQSSVVLSVSDVSLREIVIGGRRRRESCLLGSS